jgi:predicted enzyme related to lactoylglutathione lyase
VDARHRSNRRSRDAELAGSLGATVLFGPDDIPGTGRYASLSDPQGAAFAIHTPERPTAAFDGTPMLGRFSWHELMSSDSRAAFAFYSKLFEWENISEFDMGGGNMYLMYGQRGQRYGGIYNRPLELSHVLPNWLSYVNVKDVRKTTTTAKRAGARLVSGPMQVPGGDWTAAFADPQGAAFAIHERSTTVQTATPDIKEPEPAPVSEASGSGHARATPPRKKVTPRKGGTKNARQRAAAKPKKGSRRR